MRAHLDNDAEAVVVEKLNELVDADYVHHVCNQHRFTVGEKATLFFRFNDDMIDGGIKSIRRRQEIQDISINVQSETEALKFAVKRLTTAVERQGCQLDAANGKIMVLEEAIESLGFTFGVTIFLSAASGLYTMLGHGDHENFNMPIMSLYIAALVFVSWMWIRTGMTGILSAVKDAVWIVTKLMGPSREMESSLMKDMDSDDVAPAQRRESLLQQMSDALSVSKRRSSFQIKFDESIVMREANDLPDQSSWPHRPVLLCVNTLACPNLSVPDVGHGACPLGVPFKFSSDLFEGICLVRLKDVPSDDPEGDAAYFLGRRRGFQAIVQGKFKEPLLVADVLTGHEFVRPLKRLPPPWIVHAGTNLIGRLAPGVEIVLHDGQPRALSLLAATSQVVCADMPGNEPDILFNEIEEDVSLFGGMFQHGTVPISRRKRHLSDPRNAMQYKFDTDSVYTFDFYQNLFDAGSYSLDLGFTKIGLSKSLDGQPIQVLAKTTSGRYLWSFQVWHENLIATKPKQE
jgi:hypothetical protein